MGLPMIQGSTMMVLPPGVWKRKVACPSQVILMPRRSISLPFELGMFRPGAIPADEGERLPESHFFQALSGQGRPAAAAAVADDFLVLVAGHLVDIEFQNAARDGDRAWNRAAGGFFALADIH